jgi:hypothetical protein
LGPLNDGDADPSREIQRAHVGIHEIMVIPGGVAEEHIDVRLIPSVGGENEEEHDAVEAEARERAGLDGGAPDSAQFAR